MNPKEYLEIAKHLDEIGAYTAADLAEESMVKVAQGEPQRQQNLQGQEPGSGFFGSLENLGRRMWISTGKALYSRQDYIPGSMKNLNSFLNYSSGVSALSKFNKKLLEAKKELIDVAKTKLSRTWTPSPAVDNKLTAYLNRPDLTQEDEIREFFNWSQAEAQTYTGNKEYYKYLTKLREAEALIKGVPIAVSSASSAPSPAAAASSGPMLGPAGTFSGGTSSSRRVPPRTSTLPGSSTNIALAKIVFNDLKTMQPDLTEKELHESLRPEKFLAGYKFIGDDPVRINKINASIDASRYTPAKKQKLKNLFKLKLEDARNMAAAQSVSSQTPNNDGNDDGVEIFTGEPDTSLYPSERTGNVNDLNAMLDKLEAKALGQDRIFFKNTFNSDFREISKTFFNIKKNLNPSTISEIENRMDRLKLEFLKANSS